MDNELEPDWVSPSSLSVGWLSSAELRRGIFVATEIGGLRHWITDGGMVVRLSEGEGAFLAWALAGGDDYVMGGVFIGEVELQIDAASIESETSRRQIGDLAIRNGQLSLTARSEQRHIGRLDVPLGPIPSAARYPYSHLCKRWSLVRAGNDERNELFRREPAKE